MSANTCQKNVPWNPERSARETDYRAARRRVSKEPFPAERYKLAKQRLGIIHGRQNRVEEILALDFRKHAEKWRAETMHLSSLTRRFLHPSYLHIISLGENILPLLLQEIRNRPDHWLVALNAIADCDPAPEKATFSEAVEAWIKWGEMHGLC